MNKKIPQIKQHIYLTALALALIAIISIILQLINDTELYRMSIFDIIPESILFIVVWILIFGILTIPLIISIYITYLYLSKNRLIRILQIIIIPLIGATLIPSYYLYRAITENDNWFGIGAGLFGLSNLIIYLVNEVYFFLNLKKLK